MSTPGYGLPPRNQNARNPSLQRGQPHEFGGEAELLHRLDIGKAPGRGIGVDVRHSEIAGRLAGAAEVIDDEAEALAVVGADESRGLVERRVHIDEGNALAELLQRRVVRFYPERRDDGAGNIQRLEGLDRLVLHSGLAIRGQHESQKAGLVGDEFDPTGERHVERIGRIRDDDADDIAAPAVEIDGEHVGTKAGFLQRILDEIPRLATHRARIVEVFRHGRTGQADEFGKILHRPYRFRHIVSPIDQEFTCRSLVTGRKAGIGKQSRPESHLVGDILYLHGRRVLRVAG